MSLVETIDASFTDITQLVQQAQLTQDSLHQLKESLQRDSRYSPQSPLKTPSKRSRQIHQDSTTSPEGMILEPISSIDMLRGSEYCGQTFDSFLLFEKDSFLFVVDQV